MLHLKNGTTRKNSCLITTIILVILGVFILVVNRMSTSLPGYKARHLAAEDAGKTRGNQEYLFNSIPVHVPFRYNLTSSVVTYPWKEDEECSRFAVRLGEALSPIYMISFPRSGNTWTRYLLQGATGFFTGSVYKEKKLYDMGFLGEIENPAAGTTLLIKHHLFIGEKAIYNNSYPAVLLIRNPQNSIESLASFRAGNRSFTYAGSQNDFRIIDTIFEKYIAHWEHVATLLLKKCQYLHVVVYENLKADPMNEVHNIIKFLRMPGDPERLACLAKHAEGPANRGQPKFDPFNAAQISVMSAAVDRVNNLMLERGFPPLPFAEQLHA